MTRWTWKEGESTSREGPGGWSISWKDRGHTRGPGSCPFHWSVYFLGILMLSCLPGLRTCKHGAGGWQPMENGLIRLAASPDRGFWQAWTVSTFSHLVWKGEKDHSGSSLLRVEWQRLCMLENSTELLDFRRVIKMHVQAASFPVEYGAVPHNQAHQYLWREKYEYSYITE